VKAKNRLHIIADIDNLKYLNTKLGHDGADTVLRTFGELKKNLEDDVNARYGPIAKAYHRSGDEFNVLININDVDLKDLLDFVIGKCNEVLNQFAQKEFKSEIGKARTTSTVGIGLNRVETDAMVNRKKMERKRLWPFSKMSHLFLRPEIEQIQQ